MNKTYVHGYDNRENTRLRDQASTLVELLHSDTAYPAGSRVLEAGCGVGAQTVTLAKNSPDALITSVDISSASVEEAASKAAAAGITNVRFQQADIFNLPFDPESFDHIFVCFVLEHLPRPVEALRILKAYLKKGGTITVIEGDHGSAYFHPDSKEAHKAIQCQVELQVYVDSGRPELVEGFTKKTFTAMIESVREPALKAGIIEQQVFDKGIRDLYRTAESDGVFCYTFFKVFGSKL